MRARPSRPRRGHAFPVLPILMLLLAPGPLGCAAAGPSPDRAADDGGIGTAFITARDRVYPALVHVQPIRETYVGGRRRLATATGSGVVIDEAGHCITNYHVSGRAAESICTLSDGRKVRARLVGGDPLTDIAVIRLDLAELDARGIELHWADLGTSDDLEVGQWVLSMGSPLGLSRTMSQGIVSHTERVFPEADLRLQGGERTGFFNTWIQTTAPINPGNSGGPLVDLHGRIVGINARAALFANNLGFAIPVDVVREVVEQILDHGRVIRSTIGVECQPLAELASVYGVEGGVLISGVVAGSPADRAGLQAGDLIVSYAGAPVTALTEEEFPRACKAMADVPVGAPVEVVVLREREAKSFTIRTREMGEFLGDETEVDDWGLTVQGITPEMARERRLPDAQGVLVTGVVPGGRAYRTTERLTPGDVIWLVDGREVSDLGTFEAALDALEEERKEMVIVRVWRAGLQRLLVLEPGFDEDDGDEAAGEVEE